MKNPYLLRELTILLFVILLTYSCTKDGEKQESDLQNKMYDKEYIKNAKLNEQLDYRIFHLTKLINELKSSEIDLDKTFSGSTKKGEDADPFFFSDILYSNSIDKKSQVNGETKFSIDAFTGMSEEELAPYIKKIKDGNTSNPTFLISSFDEETQKENVIAFEFDEKGEVQMMNSDVSEEDIFGSDSGKKAVDNAVFYVASDGCQNFYKSASGCIGSGTGGGGATSSIEIKRMMINDKKESWVERAEIHFKGKPYEYTGVQFERLDYFNAPLNGGSGI